MSERLPISVCIIAGAEANRIGRALESVESWTTEIIVLLNEDVRDGTEEVARKFGAQVYREPWKGYIQQKNSVADKATQPWLLGLDCDEVVSPRLAAEIQNWFRGGRQSEHQAYSFPRCSFFCGRWIRHGDWYPDRCVRLWQRGYAHWQGAEPHDKLEVRGTIGKFRNDLLHYSNLNINNQLKKIGPYADYFVNECRNRARRARWIDLAVRPFWKFLRGYIFRVGFLDGWQGYYIAWLGSFSNIARYSKLKEAEIEGDWKQTPPGSQ